MRLSPIAFILFTIVAFVAAVPVDPGGPPGPAQDEIPEKMMKHSKDVIKHRGDMMGLSGDIRKVNENTVESAEQETLDNLRGRWRESDDLRRKSQIQLDNEARTHALKNIPETPPPPGTRPEKLKVFYQERIDHHQRQFATKHAELMTLRPSSDKPSDVARGALLTAEKVVHSDRARSANENLKGLVGSSSPTSKAIKPANNPNPSRNTRPLTRPPSLSTSNTGPVDPARPPGPAQDEIPEKIMKHSEDVFKHQGDMMRLSGQIRTKKNTDEPANQERLDWENSAKLRHKSQTQLDEEAKKHVEKKIPGTPPPGPGASPEELKKFHEKKVTQKNEEIKKLHGNRSCNPTTIAQVAISTAERDAHQRHVDFHEKAAELRTANEPADKSRQSHHTRSTRPPGGAPVAPSPSLSLRSTLRSGPGLHSVRRTRKPNTSDPTRSPPPLSPGNANFPFPATSSSQTIPVLGNRPSGELGASSSSGVQVPTEPEPKRRRTGFSINDLINDPEAKQ